MTTTYPVTLAEAKAHLRVDSSAEETLISSMIARATILFQDQTGVQCITETFVQKFDAFPAGFDPAWCPFIGVTSIKYYDNNGDQQTLDSDEYQVSVGTVHTPARIVPSYDALSWPSTYGILDAVELTYTAGFGSATTDVPDLIRQAILLQVGEWFKERENYENKRSFSAFDSIASQYKVFHK